MSYRAILERYIPMVDFISQICGTNYEVILHDVSEPECSVVSIHNGHLSGRKVGDPMTELARGLVRDKVYADKDFIANYEGRTRNGKQFVSSTYFLKEQGELVGLICINHDVSDLCSISHHLGNLMRAFAVPGSVSGSGDGYTEDLDGSIDHLSSSLIHSTVASQGVPPARMTPAEKLEVVRVLEHQGVFATKGSVGQAAQELGISEPTVYRYLRQVRREG